MAVRAVSAEVQQMLDNTTDSVDLFIAQANLVVNELLLSKGLSDDRLGLIETYLAAHFAVLSKEKGPLRRQRIGEAEEDYHQIYSAGFGATRLGQQAIMFDTSQTLAAQSDLASNPGIRSALFTVVTSKYPYDDRPFATPSVP